MPERAAPLVVGITGASGVPYAVRLVDVLLSHGREIHLSISPSGQAVLAEELDRRIDLERFRIEDLLGGPAPADGVVHYHHYKDLMAPIASGAAEEASDPRIRREIFAAMREQPWISTRFVFPMVKDGVVTFHGFLGGQEAMTALRVLAEGVPGVKEVVFDTSPPPAIMLGVP